MRALVISLALVGCMKQNPEFCPAHPDDPRCPDGMNSDGGIGSDGKMIDAPDAAPSCYGTSEFIVCPMSFATGPKTLNGTFDTSAANPMCNSTQLWMGSGQTASCFVVGTTVTIQNVSVTGNRPLVIVATGEITVTGQLDAASHIAGTPSEGPGALNPGTCGTFGAPANAIPAGGGAGASLVAAGGGGGDGGKGDVANAGGTAYAPFLTTPPGTLRAGCRGQTGGTGQGAGGTGGFGGGAVYLASGTRLTLGASAILNVSGAGGAAAGKTAGGGGGGAGGMVVLWAPDFMIANGAIVVANGGSGATGGDGNGSGAGTRGNDPDPTNPMTPAPGPTGAGGKGGAGYALNSAAASGGNGLAGQGGGGGGGGGGYIQANAGLTNAKVSPAANVVP